MSKSEPVVASAEETFPVWLLQAINNQFGASLFGLLLLDDAHGVVYVGAAEQPDSLAAAVIGACDDWFDGHGPPESHQTL